MGIFGPFDCAYCGRHFHGLSWAIKGRKVVCGICHDKFTKDMPESKWQKMTARQLKEYYAEKDRLDAQSECSYCGRTFDESDVYKFVLKDSGKICYRCAESMRITNPVYYTDEYDSGAGEVKPVQDDPILSLTLEEIPDAIKAAEKERGRRLQLYGDRHAVFIVDDVTRSYDSEEETHIVWGRMLLGKINAGDTVFVRHREGEYRLKTEKLELRKYNEKATALTEGHDGGLHIKGDVSFVYSGDIITADRGEKCQ